MPNPVGSSMRQRGKLIAKRPVRSSRGFKRLRIRLEKKQAKEKGNWGNYRFT